MLVDGTRGPAPAQHDDIDPTIADKPQQPRLQPQLTIKQLFGRSGGLDVQVDVATARAIVDAGSEQAYDGVIAEDARNLFAHDRALRIRQPHDTATTLQ
jgi:hypothetical protein